MKTVTSMDAITNGEASLRLSFASTGSMPHISSGVLPTEFSTLYRVQDSTDLSPPPTRLFLRSRIPITPRLSPERRHRCTESRVTTTLTAIPARRSWSSTRICCAAKPYSECSRSAGVKTAAVTAKDKLRKMLAHNLKGISFSSQCADGCTIEENGITGVEEMVGRRRPEMYDPDLSIFVLDAGIRLLERGAAELLYLSLSDLVEHRYAPGEPESDAFHRAIDQRVARMVALGAVVGITGDHGMSDKSNADGTPNVVFLEDELNGRFGAGAVRVICPITDPFVKHHGALGSFVRVYRKDVTALSALMQATRSLPGVELVLDGPSAAERFELPLDREGDFIAISRRDVVIGATQAEHVMEFGARLRSHGGISEQTVPLIASRPLNKKYLHIAESRRLRNFDVFELAINGV